MDSDGKNIEKTEEVKRWKNSDKDVLNNYKDNIIGIGERLSELCIKRMDEEKATDSGISKGTKELIAFTMQTLRDIRMSFII